MQKIPTIFKRDFSHTYRVLDEINPDCAWVFSEDSIQVFRKWQGMAALICQDKYYKRVIIKKNQIVPSSFILCTADPRSGKQFGWQLVDFENPQDQYYVAGFDPHLPDGTYELVGPKIFGNPEKVSTHTLISHTAHEIFNLSLTYKDIKYFLSMMPYEGLVFRHSDGRLAKIKKKDFGLVR